MAAPLIAAGIAAGASLAGAYMSSQAQKEAAAAERAARQAAAQRLRAQGQITDSEYKTIISQIDSYYNTRGSLGSEQDVNEYKAAIQGYNPEDYVYDIKDFDYSKSKEDFLNPYYSKIMSDTAQQIQHSAAGAGLGRGTGAALNIAKGTTEKSDELYRTAMQDYQQDRNFAYQQYQDAITNNQNRLNALNQANQYKTTLQGNLAQDYYNTLDARQSDLMKAQQDRMAAQTSYSTAMAGLY